MLNKRILIFSLAYHPYFGGAEIAIKEITSRVKDIEFDMVTLRFDKSDKDFERVGNVNVYRVGFGWSYLNKIFFAPMAVYKTWKLKRENKYNKYWAMMTYMLFPVVLLRMLGDKTPYVLTLQDGDPFEHVFKRPHIRVFLPLLKRGFREATVIQTISSFLASWVKKFGSDSRVEVIPNGVDIRLFENKEERINTTDKTTIITTSRLVTKNGVGDIIKSLEFLPEEVSLKILGTGVLENKLKSLAKKFGSRVEFLGNVAHKDLPKYLHDADVFVRPSLSEGMGNSFIEAMCAGLPVVATPVGGITDFLFDPEKNKSHPPTGLFCEVGNPKSIARQVDKLMQNNNLRESIITNAKRLVRDKYDWDLIAEEMQKRVF